ADRALSRLPRSAIGDQYDGRGRSPPVRWCRRPRQALRAVPTTVARRSTETLLALDGDRRCGTRRPRSDRSLALESSPCASAVPRRGYCSEIRARSNEAELRRLKNVKTTPDS